MKILSFFITIIGIGALATWVGNHHPEAREYALSYFEPKLAFQPKYSLEQVLENHRRLLSKSTLREEPHTSYVPLLLMEVKYADSQYTTDEGYLLWDMSDGEMILNSKTWEKTHGLSDCIIASPSPSECKLITHLAKNGGKASMNAIQQALGVDVESTIEACQRKKLILPHASGYRLHIRSPKLPSTPTTIFDGKWATVGVKKLHASPRQYTQKEIIHLARSLFPEDFTIKTIKEIYLPIYSTTLMHKSGLIQTHCFNAFTGKMLNEEMVTY